MIVMGGNFTNSINCDVPTIGGQHNLNLGQEDVDPPDAKWYQFLPNLTEYQVPSAVINIAGGAPTGAATQTAPPNGFNDSALSIYFAGHATYATRTPTRYIPPSTNHPRSGGSSHAPLGAIIGGAVGGAVVLILVALLGWCCLRRRRRAREAGRTSPPAHSHGQPSEMPGNTTYEQQYAKGSHIGSPTSTLNPPTPYTTPPPQFPQHHHPAHQPSPQVYAFPTPQIHQERNSPVLNRQRFSPQQYEMSASPSMQQEFFPAPDSRLSPGAQGAAVPRMHEMPVTRTPRMSQSMHQPVPLRADTQISSSSGGNGHYYDEKRQQF